MHAEMFQGSSVVKQLFTKQIWKQVLKGLAIKKQIPCCSAQRCLVSCVLRTCHNAIRIHPELTSFLKVKGKWMGYEIKEKGGREA